MQKANWAVLQLNPEESTCSCSCLHAKNLMTSGNSGLFCWHIMYLRYTNQISEQMEVCVNYCDMQEVEANEDEYVVLLFYFVINTVQR